MYEYSDAADQEPSPEYNLGYEDMMSLHAYAQLRGWRVPERIIVRELFLLEHSASQLRNAQQLPVLEHPAHSPDWYRGRAAAIREILRQMRAHQADQ